MNGYGYQRDLVSDAVQFADLAVNGFAAGMQAYASRRQQDELYEAQRRAASLYENAKAWESYASKLNQSNADLRRLYNEREEFHERDQKMLLRWVNLLTARIREIDELYQAAKAEVHAHECSRAYETLRAIAPRPVMISTEERLQTFAVDRADFMVRTNVRLGQPDLVKVLEG